MKNKRNKSKKAQEEMVGFGLIIIIVAIILLVFLGFAIKKPQKEMVESYEVESFIQAILSYTTDCGDYTQSHNSVQQLIFKCRNNEICEDDRNSCDVLNSTLSGLIDESWKIGAEWPTKAYSLNISVNQNQMLLLEKGNSTANSKGSVQEFSKQGDSIAISFKSYF